MNTTYKGVSYLVPKEKIVLGKPATPRDATNSGYVPWEDLHDWAMKAASDPRCDYW